VERFFELTRGHVVIMGHHTFTSVPDFAFSDSCAAVAVSKASNNGERGPRHCASSSKITKDGLDPDAVEASALSTR
jgi:dihydrofolate reductase